MKRIIITSVLVPSLALSFTGCAEKPITPNNSSVSVNQPPPPTVDSHAHAHPSEGPHHGDLIELGNEEYHAEMTHDAKSITIYILDSSAKTAVPIEATELTINLLQDGKPAQHKLTATPAATDPTGKSSVFSLKQADLVKAIESHDAAPKLNVTIDGKAYRGEIKHSHDHDHDHDH